MIADCQVGLQNYHASLEHHQLAGSRTRFQTAASQLPNLLRHFLIHPVDSASTLTVSGCVVAHVTEFDHDPGFLGTLWCGFL